MNDGTEYAEMLKNTVSSCDVIIKPTRKRRKKDVKSDVIAKVNADDSIIKEEVYSTVNDTYEDLSDDVEKNVIKEIKVKKNKKKLKFDLLYAQGVAVFVLIVGILLTNIFWENSGINVLFRKVFAVEQTATDTRSYRSFSAQSPSSNLESSVESGIMTFSGKGALYPVCDGVVSSIAEENGKYTVTLSHSGIFKTVISGVDFVYCEEGEDVFRYVPVCYVNGGEAKVKMYDEDVLVTNFVLEGNSIVWSV